MAGKQDFPLRKLELVKEVKKATYYTYLKGFRAAINGIQFDLEANHRKALIAGYCAGAEALAEAEQEAEKEAEQFADSFIKLID